MKKILIYILFPILLSACADEQYELSGPYANPGKAEISIDITAGNFHKPVTKGVNPDAVFSNPYILSFKLKNNGSATDTILHEVVKTNLDGGKYTAQLAKSAEPHLLVFIANADTLVKHRLINHSIISKKYGEVMPLFTYGDPANDGLDGLKNPTTAIPFVRERIPMWAKLNVDKIEPGSKITTPVYLQRIVSKIYIDASEANKKNNFTLNGFTVLDVPSHAYIDNDGPANSFLPQLTVNYGTTSSGATEINGLILTNISNNTTASVTDDKPVYVFPFRKDDDRGGVYHIVFSGHFGDNVTKYFKVKIGGPDSPAALNKPNTAYQINIQSIANNGYVSLEQALQYEAGTGVVVKVTLLDNSHEIVANGQYYMGLSNSEYLLCDDGSDKRVVIATLSFDKSPGSNVDLNALRKSMRVDGTGLSADAPDWIPGKTVEIVARLAKGFTQGKVTFTIGDLSKVVTVKRMITTGHHDQLVLEGFIGFDYHWVDNPNNFEILGGPAENLKLNLSENINPVRWVVYDPESLAETQSSSDNYAAEPVFEVRVGRVSLFDKVGQRGTTVLDIKQPAPEYAGWFGGAEGAATELFSSEGFKKRLIISSDVKKHFPLSVKLDAKAGINRETGRANTVHLINKGNSSDYPAAWYCWNKNDKNFDGVIDAAESVNPWYLPSHTQLIGIILTWNAQTKFTSRAAYWSSTAFGMGYCYIPGFFSLGNAMDICSVVDYNLVRCVRDL